MNGAEGTGNLTTSRTYHLTCSGAGGSITRTVVVSVALPPLGTPSGLQATCNAAGNQVTLSWNGVSGATMYPLRVDDLTNGWDGSCASPDECRDVYATSYTRSVVSGRTYGWWVHAYRLADGSYSGAATGPSFRCDPPVYACNPASIANATLCAGDNTGLTANTASTVVTACGAPKCEFTCNAGFTRSGNTCVPACTPSCANAPNVCSGQWFSDGCGGSCYGSKNCTPAPTLNFWADSTNLAYNTGTTLRWNSTNATSCTASGNWSGGKVVNGAEGTGNLTTSRTYHLTCSGAGGSITRTVVVNVALPPLGTPSGLQATCNAAGNQVTLSWNGVSGATMYPLRVDDLTNGWSGTCASPDECRDVYATSYTRAVVPGRSYNWWVHAYRAADGAGSGAAIGTSFRCDPPPTLTLAVDSANLAYNGATTLRWNSTNATSCTASGNWSGGKAVNGAEGTGNLTSSRTYTLTCSGAGGSITRTVTVNVALPPLGTPSGLQANCGPAGNQVTLSWNGVSGATMYPLRVDDQTTGWSGTCASPDECRDVYATSYTRAVVPGRSYNWWVHAYRGADGATSGAAIGADFRCNAPVTVSGRVLNQSTGAGIAGVSIPACAANPGTTTNASGNFSFSVPYDAGYCIRLNPEARAGMDGPVTTGNIPSLQYMHTYEYQRAGVNCAAVGCGAGWDTYDRSTDTGFNFAYTNITYSCNPASIANATLCSGDNTGLTANTNSTVVAACGAPKCEFTCNSGFTRSGNACVASAGASCSISPVALGGGQYRLDYTINWGTYNLAAFVGSGGSTLWQQINKSGSPQSGSFIDTPTASTTYTITPLTGFSPGPPTLCTATVNPPVPPTLGVTVSPNPASGNAPLPSGITATVSGTATGTINYHFYCDGATLTRSYLGQSATSMTHTCTYATAGSYSPRVDVERSTAPRASGTANVNVGNPSPMLTVTLSGGGSGNGRVTSSPEGIDCGSDCSKSYALNTDVTLTAAATSALGRFNSWSGACSGSSPTCTVRMDAAKSATAVFDAVPPCTCRAAEDDDYCQGKTYTNSCGNTCNGSKNCGSGPYKEVTP